MVFPLVQRFGRQLLLVWFGLITLKLIMPEWMVRPMPHHTAIFVTGLYNQLIVVFPFAAAILWVLFRAQAPVRVRIVGEERR